MLLFLHRYGFSLLSVFSVLCSASRRRLKNVTVLGFVLYRVIDQCDFSVARGLQISLWHCVSSSSCVVTDESRMWTNTVYFTVLLLLYWLCGSRLVRQTSLTTHNTVGMCVVDDVPGATIKNKKSYCSPF